MSCPFNPEALKSEIRHSVIDAKANACPMIIRLAWHASGTYDSSDGTGGGNGALMRYHPESEDPANAGLSIARDLLLPVKMRHPELSFADLWAFAGGAAVEFSGGPRVPYHFGRVDGTDGLKCPAHGRLPDASQDAAHVRKVFRRMGFDDRETVALIGAHTLGRCHLVRSGYDGPWTRNPLKFDNAFFKNLMFLEWRPRQWDGPLQYEDVDSGELMMLPTDMALREDAQYRVHAERYARDEQAFFDDFAAAFAKLLSLGSPAANAPAPEVSEVDRISAEFREAAMHGSLSVVQRLAPRADVHQLEASSARSALHKAAFWGHEGTVSFLVSEPYRLNTDARDYNGDTPLHDAARFGHTKVVEILLRAGADRNIKNSHGKTPLMLATEHDKPAVVALLQHSRM